MPPTEAVDDEQTQLDQETAQPGAPVEQPKTPGEAPGARPPATGDSPKAGSDDPVAENDPLVLARKGALETAKAKPPAKQTEPKPDQGAGTDPPAEDAEPKPSGESAAGTDDPPKEPDAKAPKPEPVEDDPLLNAKLSDEAWSALSHKDKALFLGVQKVARVKAEAAAKAQSEAAKYRTGYHAIEKFVADQGLDDSSFRNSVIIAGLVARGDKRALPLLEESVARLRKQHGIPDQTPPPPAKPAVDPDELMAALDEAETTLELGAVRKLVEKLKGAPAEPPRPRQPAGAEPKAPEAPAPNAQAAKELEDHVYNSIGDYLTENGIKPDQVVPYLQDLMTKNPALRAAPVQDRLRAVMKAHSAARASAPPRGKPPVQQTPISGRGRPGGGTGRTATPTDPLERARTPGTPESRGSR